MYTAVAERKREIGIMKAIGAHNHDIMLIFVIESGFLGFAGGVIGIVLGAFISKMIELIAGMAVEGLTLKAHFSAELIFGVLFFAFALGSLSGFFPARKASRLQPVDALRK
jgi:putative ABC transport system permease protein